MANAAQQMPEHVESAYKGAVDNIIFLKRQQWLATNYALLVYAAIFVISAHYFSRTDLARNWLGVLTIATFVIHWCMLHVFQRSIEKFRSRLGWIYRTISAKMSVLDWIYSWNQDHIGISRSFTLAS